MPAMTSSERDLELNFIEKLRSLKYEYREDIRDRSTLEQNFREKFEALNRVRLTDGEFTRPLDEIVTPDVFTAAKTLRQINAFTRDDGTPLNYTLINIKDWCKNTYEVINQLRINTDNSHHRYDVLILINGVPVTQIELKTLGIQPRRAMEQIVDYKNDSGNGYTKTLLCFLQLFIVNNRDSTYYFANNNARHFTFNADKVIVSTIQKLGLALDETSKRNQQQKKDDRQTCKEQLEPLRDKHIVFIKFELENCLVALLGQIFYSRQNAGAAKVECLTIKRNIPSSSRLAEHLKAA